MARNISAGYAGAAVNGATLLILTPLVIRSLGTLEYGLWVTATALGSYFGSLNAGSGAAGVRAVATGAAQGSLDRASRELGSIFRVYCVLGVLACVGLIGLGFLTLERFGVPPELRGSMRWLLALIGINFLVSFPFGLTRSALAGMHCFGLLNGIEIVTALFRLAATAALLAAGMGVVALGVVQLVASIGGHVARWHGIRRLAPEVHLTGGPTYRKLVPQAFLFSALSFGYESLRTLFDNADLLILGLLAGPQSVALFAVAATAASFVSKGLQPVSNVLFPLASRADSQQGPAQARLLEVATRVNLALALPVVTLLMVDGGTLLRLWAGETFASSLPILRALALAALVTAASLASTTLLFGAGRVGVLLGAESWRYVLNLVLVIAGFHFYGLPGAAVGTLAATLGIDAWLVLRRGCPWGGVDPRSFVIHAVGAPLLTGLPVVLLMAAWKSWAPDPSLPLLLARCAACLGGFALMYGLSGTFREERRLVVRAWAEVFR